MSSCTQQEIQEVCSTYDLTDGLDNMRLWVNATWYDEKELMLNAGMSQECYDSVYYYDTPKSIFV